jgi:nucleoside phosphorylase
VRFDTIVVPRGAEARAVERGWPAPRPPIREVVAGARAGDALINGRVMPTVLVLGVCGALDPELRVGDAVAYGRVVVGETVLELDPELAAACALTCGRAPVVAADVAAVIGAAAAKAALRAASGAAVVDMEAAAILRALQGRGARVAMVRVVSDDAHHDLPDLAGMYDSAGALRPLVLAAALARAPVRGVRFVLSALRALSALSALAERLAQSAVE